MYSAVESIEISSRLLKQQTGHFSKPCWCRRVFSVNLLGLGAPPEFGETLIYSLEPSIPQEFRRNAGPLRINGALRRLVSCGRDS